MSAVLLIFYKSEVGMRKQLACVHVLHSLSRKVFLGCKVMSVSGVPLTGII